MKTDWLVVGAGFTGAILAERLASQLGQQVLVVDSRPHIGGNAYDYVDEHGIHVHKYGPHIFHTNSAQVWTYLSQFTKWRSYYHRVLVAVQGQKVPLPFNLNSLRTVFPTRRAERLERLLIQHFDLGRRVPLSKLHESAVDEIRDLAEYIYENIYLHYTRKQWGLDPEDLDPSVLARVPVSISHDSSYFADSYQAMPLNGYSELFRRLLSHRNIRVLLNTDHREIIGNEGQYERMIYTGAIDAFFNFRYGQLPYRSARFVFRHRRRTFYQPTGSVNYPNGTRFTRITEFKHLTGQSAPGTTVAFEYPEAYTPGQNLPLYPIPQAVNHELYDRYRELANALGDRVIFAGRLADYRYYNMDQAAARALKVFDDIAHGQRCRPEMHIEAAANHSLRPFYNRRTSPS